MRLPTTEEEARGVRISGITVTPRALSRITLFFTVSTAQTITNSTNEALQYRESRNRSRRQLSATLRCSRQSSRNDYATLFNAQLLVLRKLRLLSSDLFISTLQSRVGSLRRVQYVAIFNFFFTSSKNEIPIIFETAW